MAGEERRLVALTTNEDRATEGVEMVGLPGEDDPQLVVLELRDDVSDPDTALSAPNHKGAGRRVLGVTEPIDPKKTLRPVGEEILARQLLTGLLPKWLRRSTAYPVRLGMRQLGTARLRSHPAYRALRGKEDLVGLARALLGEQFRRAPALGIEEDSLIGKL